MNNFNFAYKVFIFAILSLFLFSFLYPDSTTTGCMNIYDDNLGQTITLTQDINGFTDSCFKLDDTFTDDSNYLEIDCNYRSIDINQSSLGLFESNNLDLNSITFRRCDFNFIDSTSFDVIIQDVNSDLNYIYFIDSNILDSDSSSIFYDSNVVTDSFLSFSFSNLDANYLLFNDLNLNMSYGTTFLTIDTNSDLNYVVFNNSDLNLNNDIAVQIDNVYDDALFFDFNNSTINYYGANSAFRVYQSTYSTISFLDFGTFVSNAEEDIFWDLESDINNVNFLGGSLEVNSGSFILFRNINNNQIDFNFSGLDLNMNSGSVFTTGVDTNISQLNIYNLNATLNSSSKFFYYFDLVADPSDLNTLRLSNSVLTLNSSNVFFDYDKAAKDSTLIFDFNNVTSSTLLFSDLNLDLASDFITVEGTSDVNTIDLSFLNTPVISSTASIVKLDSNDSSITLNFNNSDFNFQGSSKALQIGSAIGSITVNDLNIITFNSDSAVYSISGDVNSFVSNLVSDAIITNTTANLFMFVDTNISGLVIDLNNRDLNFANDVFWFDNSVVSDLNIKNFDLIDSTNLFTTINDSNLSNLYLFDSNIKYDTLFDLNGRLTAKVWNNYFVDKNTDNNAIIIESPRVSSDVNVDFNVALTTATNIVSKSYKGGNYWTNTSATSPGTDTSGDYIYDTARLIYQANDKNYYDYLPLTLVRSADLQPTDISLNSSVSGTTSTATCTVRNNGDVSTSGSYTTKFYVDDVQQGDTNTSSTAVAPGSTKTVTFSWAPAPTTSTTYDLNCVVTYTDWNTSNNNYQEEATITYSSSNSPGGGSSDNDSGIDLDAKSLTYSAESQVNKPVTFTFTYKNIGDTKLTDSYVAKIIITQKGETIKTLSQTITDDLAADASKTYTATWTPTKTGYYSVEASVEYEDDDDTSNDAISDKLLHVTSTTTTTTSNTNSANTITSTKTLSTNKTLQSASDFNTFIKDLNIAIADIIELTLPDINDINNIYLPVEVTRTFKCDSNTNTCDVTLSLHNVGTTNLSGYKYVEVLPEINNNERYLTFDLNDLNASRYAILNYSVAASNVDANTQAKFFGLVTNDTSTVILTKNKSSWNIPWKTIGFVIAIIVGVGILVLLVYYLIRLIAHTRSGFRYYKSHESRREEEAPRWKGIGSNEQKVPYKGGKYKVHSEKHSGPKYKGWN